MKPSGKSKDPGKTRRRESAANLQQRDFDSDVQGRNKLQGKDQLMSRNQRRSQPAVGGATGKPSTRTGKSGED